MRRLGGIELGGTKVRCAIGGGPDSVEATAYIPTTDPETTLAQVVEFFGSHPLPDGIGVGCFGPLDLVAGRILQTPKPGWSGVDVGALLAKIGVPIVLDTDVAAALTGERIWGAGQGVERLAYITVGTGIGATGGAGATAHPEVGHVPIPREPNDPLSRGICPFHPDCLEGWASGPSLWARWGDPSVLAEDHPAWDLQARYLAQGLRSIALSLAPQRILVGGGVGLRPGLVERIHPFLDEVMGGYGGFGASSEWVQVAALGEDAGLLGAMGLVR